MLPLAQVQPLASSYQCLWPASILFSVFPLSKLSIPRVREAFAHPSGERAQLLAYVSRTGFAMLLSQSIFVLWCGWGGVTFLSIGLKICTGIFVVVKS